MNAPQRCMKFLRHIAKRRFERRASSDQHVIMAGVQDSGARKPYDFPQPTPHPVALHGVAHLLRHGESNPHRFVVRASARLHRERPAGGPDTGRGSPKVRSAFQPLHGGRFSEEAVGVRH
jgi:hypothetical protein